MTERDRRQWAAFERVVAPGSGASDSERATAQKKLDALRARYGQRPPDPEVRRERHRRPYRSDDWAGRWSDAYAYQEQQREAEERVRTAEAVTRQRARVEAVPNWQDIGGLGELYRARHVWTRDEERRFKDLAPRS